MAADQIDRAGCEVGVISDWLVEAVIVNTIGDGEGGCPPDGRLALREGVYAPGCGPALVSFRSGADVKRPSFRKPRGISSRESSVFGADCRSR